MIVEAPKKVEKAPLRLLEKSGRITPREVLEAYEETGLYPKTRDFFDGERACAIGALRRHQDLGSLGYSGYMRSRIGKYHLSYPMGFTNAFDGMGVNGKSAGYLKGYRDGQRVRRFVESRYGSLS
jgi:hypothetical protein